MPFSELSTQIRVVLVQPSDPGNIGAAARAMKTMGLKRLYLVAAGKFPHHDASVRASHALNILGNALLVDSLQAAIKDCSVVFGTSARERELHWISLSPQAAAEKITGMPSQEIAIVFGRERCGLTNQELQQCHFQINIPTSQQYNSLNLAAAVQIICYELRVAFLRKTEALVVRQRELASLEQLEYFYQHLHTLLMHVEFLHSPRSQQIMDRLRRLFGRTELDKTELNILRGILSAIQKKLS